MKDAFSLDNIPLPRVDSETALNELICDMLMRFHTAGKDQAMDARVEKAYEEFTGRKFRTFLVTPTTFMGGPGVGKTITFKSAAERVAGMLGLKYVENPREDFKVGKSHLLFITQHSYGENSSLNYAGIAMKGETESEDGRKHPTMVKLLNSRFVMLGMAGAAVLLFDDFGNAHESIQSTALSIANENIYQSLDLRGVYIGYTSNFGAADGTSATALATAIVRRTRTVAFYDTPDAFARRAAKRFADDLGDAFVPAFLKMHPDLLFKLEPYHSSGVTPPFPNPASWDMVIEDVRRHTYLNDPVHGERAEYHIGSAAARDMLTMKVCSRVGLDVGKQYCSFLYEHAIGAEPLARAVIQDGANVNFEVARKVKAKAGDGFSPDAFSFQVAFIESAAKHAAAAISRDPADVALRRRVFENFHHAMLGMSIAEARFADGYNALSRHLVSLVPDFRPDTASREFLHPKVVAEVLDVLKSRMSNYAVSDNTVKTTVIPALTGSTIDVGYMEAMKQAKKPAGKAAVATGPSA